MREQPEEQRRPLEDEDDLSDPRGGEGDDQSSVDEAREEDVETGRETIQG